MKNYHILIKIIFFLLFTILLAYPNKLFEGLYINYLYIVFTGCLLLFLKKGELKINKTIKFFVILFFIVLLANINSSFLVDDIDFKEYITTTFRYLFYVIMVYILINSTKTKYDVKFWISSFLFGFSLSILIVILDSFKISFIETVFKNISYESQDVLDIYFRAYGAYITPISAGIFLSNTFVILVVSLFYLKLKSKLRIFLCLLLGVTVIALFMTASRTGIVSLLVFLFLIILKSRKRFQLISLVIVLSLIIYYSGIIDSFIENILSRSKNESVGNKGALEGSGRVDTFVNAIRLFFNSRTFFYGVGPVEYDRGDGTHSYAHNGFLSTFLIHGFLGMILFTKFLFMNYKKVIKDKYLRDLLVYYTLINFIAFISSDGPATHFWMINFICFVYYINYYSMLKNR